MRQTGSRRFAPIARLGAALCATLVLTGPAAGGDRFCQPSVQITDDVVASIDPEWDPASEFIAFLRENEDAFWDIWATSSDGVTQLLAAQQEPGIVCPDDLGWSLAWVGETRQLMTAERCGTSEYLSFNPAQAPFTRTVLDGDDAAFTRKLFVGFGDGGACFDVSRDGATAAWCTSREPGIDSDVRFGPFATLAGQEADTLGTVVKIALDGDLATSSLAVSPDGAHIAWVESTPNGGSDIWSVSTLRPSPGPVTTSGALFGATNTDPDYHPDPEFGTFGELLVFASDAHDIGGDFDLYQSSRSGNFFLVNLTNTPTVSERRPTWAPDGNRLAFDAPGAPGVRSGEGDITPPRQIWTQECSGMRLEAGGSCSIGNLILSGATPNGRVAFASSVERGIETIDAGPCAGKLTGLANPVLAGIVTADVNGDFVVSAGNFPEPLCNLWLQAVDLETCLLSDIELAPTSR